MWKCLILLLLIASKSFAQETWKWNLSAVNKYTDQSVSYVGGSSGSAVGVGALIQDTLINGDFDGSNLTTNFCSKNNLNQAPYSCVQVNPSTVRITIDHIAKYSITGNFSLQVVARVNDGTELPFDNILINNNSVGNIYQVVWGPVNGTDNAGLGYVDATVSFPISFDLVIKGANFKADLENTIDFYVEVSPI